MIMEFAFADCFLHDPTYMVCVDFNGETAYAYLCRDHLILAEVWLYNVAPAPRRREWREDSVPVLNPREFVREDLFRPPSSRDEIDVQWFRVDGEIHVSIFIHDELHATLLAGNRIGSCRLARKNGPLARKLTSVL